VPRRVSGQQIGNADAEPGQVGVGLQLVVDVEGSRTVAGPEDSDGLKIDS
jgi:hypothetical protein